MPVTAGGPTQPAASLEPAAAAADAPPRRAAERPAPRAAGARRVGDRRRCSSLAVLAGGRDRRARRHCDSVYFVGQDRGLVTLYRGVPYELPFGINLYETPVRQLGAGARR